MSLSYVDFSKVLSTEMLDERVLYSDARVSYEEAYNEICVKALFYPDHRPYRPFVFNGALCAVDGLRRRAQVREDLKGGYLWMRYLDHEWCLE